MTLEIVVLGAMATLAVAMNVVLPSMLTLRVKHGTHKLNRHQVLELTLASVSSAQASGIYTVTAK